LLATIKIHSAYSHLFSESEYKADLITYSDIMHYLKSMHPKFNHYVNLVDCGQAEETFGILDSDYNIVANEDLFIRQVKEDTTIHIVPMIAGGGGKRGGLFAIMAVAGLAVATGGLGLAAAGSGAGAAGGYAAAAGGGAAGASAAAAGYSAGGGGLFSAFSAMPGFAKSMLGNIAMSFISSLFNKKPKAQQETDQSTRENGMFGGLTNSTQSGTPIALHYGLVRVAGQFISGYIESEEHAKNDVVKVGDKF